MTIYYLNSKKQEKTLTNVKHIQCSDNHVLYATTEDGTEHTLVVENVTGIIDKDENELNEAQRDLDEFKRQLYTKYGDGRTVSVANIPTRELTELARRTQRCQKIEKQSQIDTEVKG